MRRGRGDVCVQMGSIVEYCRCGATGREENKHVVLPPTSQTADQWSALQLPECRRLWQDLWSGMSPPIPQGPASAVVCLASIVAGRLLEDDDIALWDGRSLAGPHLGLLPNLVVGSRVAAVGLKTPGLLVALRRLAWLVRQRENGPGHGFFAGTTNMTKGPKPRARGRFRSLLRSLPAPATLVGFLGAAPRVAGGSTEPGGDDCGSCGSTVILGLFALVAALALAAGLAIGAWSRTPGMTRVTLRDAGTQTAAVPVDSGLAGTPRDVEGLIFHSRAGQRWHLERSCVHLRGVRGITQATLCSTCLRRLGLDGR